jgi:hypothetical protein
MARPSAPKSKAGHGGALNDPIGLAKPFIAILSGSAPLQATDFQTPMTHAIYLQLLRLSLEGSYLSDRLQSDVRAHY